MNPPNKPKSAPIYTLALMDTSSLTNNFLFIDTSPPTCNVFPTNIYSFNDASPATNNLSLMDTSPLA